MDLAELIDRHAIHQVLLRYARGLDRLDNALVRGCYWDDAIEDHGHFVGTPGDFVPWADRTTLLFETTQHAILNHVCDLQGDEAFCETTSPRPRWRRPRAVPTPRRSPARPAATVPT
ncbi:nuclear transport factor 2 family protein [Novosphingobium resinovorum]|uniref:SnoaL-like domain-containing protein n=1 Tax=Novosphingobium resinovorum TaxID=158500 RepID=A0A1D8A7C3_9SPHN|nr:nuclear transport factor 2 family protein [Novosphingobium resinovorum]AOR78019.1 hypothetical protein BES08_15605 [Novosphingobium resinovorum]